MLCVYLYTLCPINERTSVISPAQCSRCRAPEGAYSQSGIYIPAIHLSIMPLATSKSAVRPAFFSRSHHCDLEFKLRYNPGPISEFKSRIAQKGTVCLKHSQFKVFLGYSYFMFFFSRVILAGWCVEAWQAHFKKPPSLFPSAPWRNQCIRTLQLKPNTAIMLYWSRARNYSVF